MSAYSDAVIALSPVFYGRLDDLPGATVITDLSGFGNHGVYHASAGFGQASPIETDAASKAISGRVGYVPPLPLIAGFTWMGWVLFDPTVTSAIMLAANGGPGLNNSNWVGIDESQLRARLSPVFGTTHDLLSVQALVPYTWYFVAVVRNAGVIRLYINAVLVDEDTGFQVGDFAYPDYENSSWKIGAATNTVSATTTHGNVGFGAGTDEPALFDYALSQAQLQVVYEAALNSLLLNGYSTVIPTAILYSDIEPTPTSFPFRHNWTEPLVERISFRTNISRARTGSEEAAATRVTPRREIEFVQVLRDDAERRKLRARLWGHQHHKWFIPMLEDREQLLVGVSAGAGSIPATTAYKDYAVGGYVELRQLDDRGVVVKSENLEIESFTTSAITPVTGPVNTYDPFISTVGPARRGYIAPQFSIRGHSSSVEEMTITARLLAEDEAVAPNRITSWSPSLKYRDYEVLNPSVWQSNDWSEFRDYDIDRVLEFVDFDVGMFSPHSDTAGASEAFSYRMIIKGRADIAAFLGWFYERAGSFNYLWVPTMQHDFEIVSATGADLTVTGTEYSDNFALAEPRRDLAFVYEDGSLELRRVIGFSGVTNETLELDANVPTLTNLRSLSLLKFCRLDGDVLEIAKVTDDLWVFAWRFRELLETPAGMGPSSLSPSASASTSLSPSSSPSPSASNSPSLSPSQSQSPSASGSPSASQSPSASVSPSRSPSASTSPSASASPSA